MDPSINLLVGVNGSGKSHLVKVIQLLKTGVDGNANDSALRELVIDKWGRFDNIYCKTGKKGDYTGTPLDWSFFSMKQQ